MSVVETKKYSRADFASDNQVRWCPGCGDFNILMAIQNMLPKTGKKKEDVVFISGIGCSSRFPYYMNTYGFHTIHGRAPAIATGVKTANPDLDVWVITGDGDGLSIGGNHLIHAIRRNQDVKIMMFNNQIYGLTKGQFSPTSQKGITTGSSPYGSVDYPLNPIATAVSANGGFIARTADDDPKHMAEVFEAASKFKGTCFVEILQNCVIFNDKVHEDYYGRKERSERMLYLKDGEPMIFGKDGNKGIVLEGMTPKIVNVTDENRGSILVHNASEEAQLAAYMLAQFAYPDMPIPMGVIRMVSRTTFDQLVTTQIEEVQAKQGEGDLHKLFHAGTTWTVE